jgi:hypothetical protein
LALGFVISETALVYGDFVGNGETLRDIVHPDMGARVLLLIVLISSAFGSEKMTAPQLIELSRSNRAALPRAITMTFDAKELKAGSSWAGRGSDFFFPIETISKPLLFIDGARGPEMEHLDGTGLWYAKAQIPQLGRLHSFHYVVNGVSSAAVWMFLHSDLSPMFRRACH